MKKAPTYRDMKTQVNQMSSQQGPLVIEQSSSITVLNRANTGILFFCFPQEVCEDFLSSFVLQKFHSSRKREKKRRQELPIFFLVFSNTCIVPFPCSCDEVTQWYLVRIRDCVGYPCCLSTEENKFNFTEQKKTCFCKLSSFFGHFRIPTKLVHFSRPLLNSPRI